MIRRVAARLAFAGLLVLLANRTNEAQAVPSESVPSPAAGDIRLEFDYSAAERMAEAIERPSLDEEEARALLQNLGLAAMVAKPGFYSPRSTPDAFVSDLQNFVVQHRYRGDFALDWIYRYRDQLRTLVNEMRADEDNLRDRITGRLTRYAPRTGPVTIKVYFVAGGMSDGFVLDGDPELALFVALEKASGDREGVEQNITHELYHVLQKASAAGTPPPVSFASSLEQQPPVQRLLATTLWEETANLAADARETKGEGPYASMWRGRYLRNLTPDRLRENFQVFDSVLVDLERGSTDWATAKPGLLRQGGLPLLLCRHGDGARPDRRAGTGLLRGTVRPPPDPLLP